MIKVDYSRFRTAEEMAKVIKAEYALIANVRHVHFDNISSPSARKNSSDGDNSIILDESDVSFEAVSSPTASPSRGVCKGHAAVASS